MAKYSKGAQAKVEETMHEMKKGTLKSGRSDKKVTDPRQAIAIGLSEAREKGANVPAKKTSAKKSATKKAPAKKSAVKTTAAKKAPAKKAPAKKSAVKKAPAKKKNAAKKTS